MCYKKSEDVLEANVKPTLIKKANPNDVLLSNYCKVTLALVLLKN